MFISRGFYSLIFYGYFLTYSVEAMSIDRQHLIGNPLSLSTQNKIYISDHEITVTHWSLAQPIDEVIEKFSRQAPEDTLAWSDGLVMHMVWTSAEHSYLLAIRPESDVHVTAMLSSMRLKPIVSSGSIKSFFLNPRLAATLMLDVKDHSEEVASSTMIFSSGHSMHSLYKALIQVFNLEHWSVTEGVEKIFTRSYPRKIQARRRGIVVNMDLIEHLGKTFIYVHTSEGDRR
jgi:hypothetical protein